MKTVVILGIVAIAASLFVALVFMLRRTDGQGESQRARRMARALAVRVGLSITLFALILIGYQLGWIHPTGLPLR